MWMRLAGLGGCFVLLGCQAGATQLPPAASLAIQPTDVLSAPTVAPGTRLSTVVPTLAPPTAQPTIAPVLPEPTALRLPTLEATPAGVVPTPDASRAAQQRYCDVAAPPARIPLPPVGPTIRISQPASATRPLALVGGGPRHEGNEPMPQVSALSVAVLDDASGNLLVARDAFVRRAPASVTKIVATIVALERDAGLSPETVYTTTVSASALVACDGSSVMGLEPKDQVKLETLLYGMMLTSGNDAAEQVAVSLAGSRERYVGWMNDKVASLGMRDTRFVTPSGIDADEHYSSAYDMALLARYAMRNPTFRKIVATQSFIGDDYYMRNRNPLLGSYAGADGVKVGYTDIAGRTIVASAMRDGHRVYVSLMGSRNLAADCIALFEWVWRNFRW